MENMNKKAAGELVATAKDNLAADMQERGYAAVIWNNATAGFHFIPEIITGQNKDGNDIVVRITGLYIFNGVLYAVEEGAHGADISNYYNHDTDMPPVVVTLSETVASDMLGDPRDKKGYTTKGSNAEWLTIADCYFEALKEK